MKYYRITFLKNSLEEWCIIPINDVWRAKEILGNNFIKAEFYRDWKHQNSSVMNYTDFDTEAYRVWKQSKQV